MVGRSIDIHLPLSTFQEALGWEAIRHDEEFSGGQFGIKVEVVTEGIAAAAALNFRRAVRYVPSLAESMLITSKRHPFDMAMGVGFALREQFVAGQTKDWISFKFPTMRTAFEMDVILRETPRLLGTLGAVGVGEMSMVSTAPAIVNAIRHACGAMVFELPATPARVKAALKETETQVVGAAV